jgi:hypothetical protein
MIRGPYGLGIACLNHSAQSPPTAGEACASFTFVIAARFVWRLDAEQRLGLDRFELGDDDPLAPSLGSSVAHDFGCHRRTFWVRAWGSASRAARRAPT